MSDNVRRWDLDRDTYVTDNGPECCQPGNPGLWVYKVQQRRTDSVVGNTCELLGQCATCHRVVTVTTYGNYPDIFLVKSMHELLAS